MSELTLAAEPFLNSDQPENPAAPRWTRPSHRLPYWQAVARFHASDLEGRNDGFASTLDADTAQRYALSTTRARN